MIKRMMFLLLISVLPLAAQTPDIGWIHVDYVELYEHVPLDGDCYRVYEWGQVYNSGHEMIEATPLLFLDFDHEAIKHFEGTLFYDEQMTKRAGNIPPSSSAYFEIYSTWFCEEHQNYIAYAKFDRLD